MFYGLVKFMQEMVCMKSGSQRKEDKQAYELQSVLHDRIIYKMEYRSTVKGTIREGAYNELIRVLDEKDRLIRNFINKIDCQQNQIQTLLSLSEAYLTVDRVAPEQYKPFLKTNAKMPSYLLLKFSSTSQLHQPIWISQNLSLVNSFELDLIKQSTQVSIETVKTQDTDTSTFIVRLQRQNQQLKAQIENLRSEHAKQIESLQSSSSNLEIDNMGLKNAMSELELQLRIANNKLQKMSDRLQSEAIETEAFRTPERVPDTLGSQLVGLDFSNLEKNVQQKMKKSVMRVHY